MPLPQKVIDQLSHSSPQISGWSWRIFIFSLFILIITIVFYAGLNYGYKPYLNNKINKLESEYQQLEKSVPLSEQSKLISFYSQIENINNLVKNHKKISVIFDWLEKNTNSEVIFNKFNLNTLNNQLNLGGFSKNQKAIINQILIFQRSPEVESVVLNNMSSSQENWQFDLTVFLKKSLFEQNQQ
jgi:hypothetical protein